MLRKQITVQEALAMTLALETFLKVLLEVRDVKIELTLNSSDSDHPKVAS